jgi:mannose-6-phosphate isomerase-like protein (cupin superfamily)
MTTFALEKQGESITFFAAADSRAPMAENEILMAPGAAGPPPHIHTRQKEYFRVTSGRLVAKVDGQERVVEAGESLVVEPGQSHTFANASQTEPLVFRGKVKPALHFQWFLTEMAKAAIRSGGSWKDLPFLEAAYILFQVRGEYRVAGIPFALQDLILGSLARMAVLLGKTKNIAPMDPVPVEQQAT